METDGEKDRDRKIKDRYIEIKKYRTIDRQKDVQMGRRINRQNYRNIDGQKDKQIKTIIDRRKDP